MIIFVTKINFKNFFHGLTLVFLVLLSTVAFGNHGLIQVEAEVCGDTQLNRLYECQRTYGFNSFIRCNNECIAEKQSNFEYIQCAMDCENKLSTGGLLRSRFDANGYNECIKELTRNMPRSDLVCACNTNNSFLHNAPSFCYDYVTKPKQEQFTSSIMENIFPKCFNISESAQDLVECIRSLVNTGFLVGISILLVSIAFIGIQSTFNFSGVSLWVSILEKTRDIVIGLLFVGIPVAMLNLINDSFNTFNFQEIVELNLGKNLKNPLSSYYDENCENDEGNSGVVYHIVFEEDQGLECLWGQPCDFNIKYPTVTFYDCKVFFAASRGQDRGQHITGFFPIFEPSNMETFFNTVPKGKLKIDYAGPRAAVGPDGVAILSVDEFSDGYKVYSRFWDGTSYREDSSSEVISFSDFTIHSKPVAYNNTWLGVVSQNNDFLVTDLGSDLKNKNRWKAFASTRLSYGSVYALASTPDFSRAFFVTSREGVHIYQYSEEQKTFVKIDEITPTFLRSKGQSGFCFRPSAAADSAGDLYILCDDAAGNVLFFEKTNGSWTVEKIQGDTKFAGVVAVDEKDGVHVAFMGGRGGNKIGYIYKEKGGQWTEPVYTSDGRGGFNLSSGFAHHGKIPYMGVVYEDWWSTSLFYRADGMPRIGIILFGAEI